MGLVTVNLPHSGKLAFTRTVIASQSICWLSVHCSWTLSPFIHGMHQAVYTWKTCPAINQFVLMVPQASLICCKAVVLTSSVWSDKKGPWQTIIPRQSPLQMSVYSDDSSTVGEIVALVTWESENGGQNDSGNNLPHLLLIQISGYKKHNQLCAEQFVLQLILPSTA